MALTAALVAAGSLGVPLYIGVLAVLGVNRFFLSSLSAAMPHVVAQDKLVMANAVAPTSGTIAGFIGGFIGLGVHLVTGGGRGGWRSPCSPPARATWRPGRSRPPCTGTRSGRSGPRAGNGTPGY